METILTTADLRQSEDDVALKILHTADWHLGMRFPSFDENDQLKLSRARLEVIDDIFSMAEVWSVDAVLCAGDLFDEPEPDNEWWEGLLREFEKRAWSDRPVFLLPGNHDPHTPNSVYHVSHPFRQRLPEWVQVVDRDDFQVPLSDESVLYSRPCTSQAGDVDLALALPAREESDDRIRIGMVHGQTHHFKGYETSFPIAKDAPQRRGFDYIALGDTHSFLEIEGAPMLYPGTPEQSKFGEECPSHVAIVYFRRRTRKPRVQREKVGRWRWMEEECADIDTLRAVRNRADLGKTVLRLVLKMTVNLEEFQEVESILAELKGTTAVHGKAGVLIVDQSELKLFTHDTQCFPSDLPDTLQKTIQRLKEDGGVEAQKALYLLYKLVNDAKVGGLN